jgi:hypothetical protein
MLYAWLTICLMIAVWLCAFIALVACAPVLLTARRERWFRRLRRSVGRVCENVWWLGPRPTVITLRRDRRPMPLARSRRLPRRRAA